MSDKTKPLTYEEYKTNKGLRKRYHLYHCFRLDGDKDVLHEEDREHMYDLFVPHNTKGISLMQYYGLELDSSVKDKKIRHLPIMFRCLCCGKIHTANPRVCKNCRKLIKPISKKMLPLLVSNRYHLICNCYDKGGNNTSTLES